MTYLIDSDWVASFLKGRPEAQDLFQLLAAQDMAISLITFGEIYEGIYYGQNVQQHEAIFRRFLHGVLILPLNRPIMQQFARLRGELRRSGQIIGDFDILIAATALHHDLTLVTRNRAHFQRIAGLTLYERDN